MLYCWIRLGRLDASWVGTRHLTLDLGTVVTPNNTVNVMLEGVGTREQCSNTYNQAERGR